MYIAYIFIFISKWPYDNEFCTNEKETDSKLSALYWPWTRNNKAGIYIFFIGYLYFYFHQLQHRHQYFGSLFLYVLFQLQDYLQKKIFLMKVHHVIGDHY